MLRVILSGILIPHVVSSVRNTSPCLHLPVYDCDVPSGGGTGGLWWTVVVHVYKGSRVDTSGHFFIVSNHKVLYDVAFRSSLGRFFACQKSQFCETRICVFYHKWSKSFGFYVSVDICAFTHEHAGTRPCIIHPRTLTTTLTQDTTNQTTFKITEYTHILVHMTVHMHMLLHIQIPIRIRSHISFSVNMCICLYIYIYIYIYI